ncbi:MAG: ABC transporter ATP-binding protein [Planctomycetota bacterium]|nr:ABC transporter ATP-binding protein [Planctomycetota bacterium]
MKNFRRTLKNVLRYPWTLAASAACAILVAFFWAANIGTVYPIIEIVFGGDGGQTLQTWVDKEITSKEESIASLRNDITSAQARLATANEADRATIEWEIGSLNESVVKLEETLADRKWLRPYIYDYMPNDAFRTVVAILLLVLLGTILKNVFIVCDAILVDRLTNLAAMEVRKRFFRRTLRMELASFGENRSSELMTRFTVDMDSLHGGIQTILGRAVREPLKMIACFAGAAYVCWQLLAVSLLVAPVLGYLMSRLAQSLKRANRRAMEEITRLYSILGETFQNIKIVKAFTSERQERQRFHQNSKQIYKRAMKIARYDSLIHPLSEMIGISAISLCILSGAYLVLNKETHLFGIRMSSEPLSWAQLVLFYAFLVGATDPARKLSDVFNRLQRAVAASDRIYGMLDREPKICNIHKPQRLPRHHRDLVLKNVSFHYQPEQQVLDGVNLRIQFGESIAIVGPNGCGKSTLANLLPRFYDPVSGSIEVDGLDLRNVRLRDLRGQIGVVTQESLMFDDTVLNNIRYGSPHATREEVIQAAVQAHAHRFIEQRLEHGYETVVGQGGGKLSGGQRQRIALARAILRNPSILILDEATSQVDIESEHLIHKALENFIRNRTTILITHRLATLDLADRIVVMQAGMVMDFGTHQELMGRCELYQRLYQIQFREVA